MQLMPSYIPPGCSALPKRSYIKLIGQKFDLKIKHKSLILPDKIHILSRTRKWNGNKQGNTKPVFEVVTPSSHFLLLTYYQIQKYYLGKGSRKFFQIVSNPTIRYDQLYTRKYDILPLPQIKKSIRYKPYASKIK